MKSNIHILLTSLLSFAFVLCASSADVNHACISDCVGVADGDYQHCLGCHVYVSCSNEVISDYRPCPEDLVWDDILKKCHYTSATCRLGATTNSNCVPDCKNVTDGDYQSCLGCHVFASCSNEEISDNRICPFGLVWDDNLKTCQYTSETCTPAISFSYVISKQWDSRPTGHDPIKITLIPHKDGLIMKVNAPFFDDPGNPGGEAGEPFPGLWDFEVVEAFFLSADGNKYLEVELCPHGQHIVLLLNNNLTGSNLVKMELPMEFDRIIYKDNTWYGKAVIPAEYFPAGVSKFNAFAIHGSGENRTYEALYPAEQGQHENPNFHRLEYFKKAEFAQSLPRTWSDEAKELWELD